MINIVVSSLSDKPIYQQIFDQLSAQIIKGNLKPGQLLPPIRTVAKELRISVITIKKAWEELERQGFIDTMIGRGCFVADLSSRDILEKRQNLIDTKLKKDVRYYQELGLSVQEIIEAVKSVYDA